MKAAILADIHDNSPALRAVLEEFPWRDRPEWRWLVPTLGGRVPRPRAIGPARLLRTTSRRLLGAVV